MKAAAMIFCVVVLLLLSAKPGVTQESGDPNCPAPPEPSVAFEPMQKCATRVFPPFTLINIQLAHVNGGCFFTRVARLPNGEEHWLPYGNVQDAPDWTDPSAAQTPVIFTAYDPVPFLKGVSVLQGGVLTTGMSPPPSEDPCP